MSLTGAVPSPDLKIEVETTPAETIVHCSGRITSGTAEMLKSTVRPLIPEAKSILIDLTNVVFLDSSGLGTLVGFWVSAKKAKSKLKTRQCPSANCRSLPDVQSGANARGAQRISRDHARLTGFPAVAHAIAVCVSTVRPECARAVYLVIPTG